MSAEDHLRHWLAHGLTGCGFAALIAKERHQLLSGAFPTMADEAEVSTIFEAGGEAKLPVIAMFTGIRTESAAEIAKNADVPVVISRAEFETVWEKAAEEDLPA